jgi:2-C-methyl-D-erythritol 2,4-cyclodiphosphate synthase
MNRVGIGYDIHPLVAGRPLILGGVTIPFDKGLDGHSDADALVHAIIDAILGAAALGNIGILFPNTDAQYKNIASLKLLQLSYQKVQQAGYAIGNIDSTIICQAPKLKDFIPGMIKNLAQSLNVNQNQVSVKATTHEHLGTLGRGEGIAAQAIAMLVGI